MKLFEIVIAANGTLAAEVHAMSRMREMVERDIENLIAEGYAVVADYLYGDSLLMIRCLRLEKRA